MESIATTTTDSVSDSVFPFFLETLQGCQKLVDWVMPAFGLAADYVWQNWPTTRECDVIDLPNTALPRIPDSTLKCDPRLSDFDELVESGQ